LSRTAVKRFLYLLLALSAHKGHKVSRVFKVSRGRRVFKAIPEPLVLPAHRVSRVFRAFKVFKAIPEPRAQLVLLGHKVKQV
jgi:hypothetical protein